MIENDKLTGLLEPGASTVSGYESRVNVSMAISLKRIADALDKLLADSGPLVAIMSVCVVAAQSLGREGPGAHWIDPKRSPIFGTNEQAE